MTEKFRLAAVIALLVMTVLVDFASKLMSVAADGILVGLAIYFATQLLNKQKH
ncbi:DUF3927 domain-containing protein [Cronobacter sakazakii]|nr:DUF3927 domain-containing protein [Cronobacter sakazakii]